MWVSEAEISGPWAWVWPLLQLIMSSHIHIHYVMQNNKRISSVKVTHAVKLTKLITIGVILTLSSS